MFNQSFLHYVKNFIEEIKKWRILVAFQVARGYLRSLRSQIMWFILYKPFLVPYESNHESVIFDPPSLKNPKLTPPNKRVVLFTWGLGPGGAERQFVYTAIGLKARGFQVEVICMTYRDAESRHYGPLLQKAQIPVQELTQRDKWFGIRYLRQQAKSGGKHSQWMQFIHPSIRGSVIMLMGRLAQFEPTLLYCFLDHTNIIGAWAGILAGTDNVVLSFRNYIPWRFAYMNIPWYKDMYEIFIKHSAISFESNSHAGAEDYAQWLNIDPDRITVIPNGLDETVVYRPDDDALQKYKASQGLNKDTRVIAGVFRLSDEKRPFDFIEVINQVKQQIPHLRAFIAGIGPLQGDIEHRIQELGLADTIILLGRTDKIPLIMSAADILLVTSEFEGFPNVVVEALWLGCTPVATNTGDIPRIIRNGETGYVHTVGDVSALAASATKLLRDERLRQIFGAAGRNDIRDKYLLGTRIENFLNYYETLQRKSDKT